MILRIQDKGVDIEADEEINWAKFPRCIREFLSENNLTPNRRSSFKIDEFREILPSLQDGSYWGKQSCI